jgi:hypothetical protein
MVAAVCLMDTALLPASSVNSPANRLVPASTTLVSPLFATLTRPPTSVHSKGLTRNLSPLDATLTRNRGEGSTAPVNIRHLPPDLFVIPSEAPNPLPSAVPSPARDLLFPASLGVGALVHPELRGAPTFRTAPHETSTLVLPIRACFRSVRRFLDLAVSTSPTLPAAPADGLSTESPRCGCRGRGCSR